MRNVKVPTYLFWNYLSSYLVRVILNVVTHTLINIIYIVKAIVTNI